MASRSLNALLLVTPPTPSHSLKRENGSKRLEKHLLSPILCFSLLPPTRLAGTFFTLRTFYKARHWRI